MTNLTDLPVCPHEDTFECHNRQRCSECYVDSYTLRDGSLWWPAQNDPMSWTAQQIADWFVGMPKAGIHDFDGITFARNNLVQPSIYGYVWIDLALDLDYYAAWMLDVRRHDGDDEYRQRLFVGMKHVSTPTVEWVSEAHRIFDGTGDLISDMYAFTSATQRWLERKEH